MACGFAAPIAPLVVAVGIGGWLAFAPYVEDGMPVRDPRGVAQEEAALADALRARGNPVRRGPVLAGLPADVPVRRRPGGRAARRRDDRYRPYRDGFEAAPVVAYLFHPSEPRAQWETTAAELDAQGVTYRREEIAGFTVLIVRR